MIHKTICVTLLALGVTLSACGEPKRIVQALPTPPERLVCEMAGPRPSIPSEYAIDWAHVTSVAQAKVEHENYVHVQREREGAITSYLISVEGKLFRCADNMAWRRDYEKPLR